MTELAIDRDAELERGNASWKVLLQFLDTLSPDDRDLKRNPQGWSPKDHLAHIASWNWWMIDLLLGGDGYPVLNVSANFYQNNRRNDFEVVNAIILEHRRHDPWVRVRADADLAHREMFRLMAEAPLDLVVEGQPVANHLAWMGWNHYDEHFQWIREQLADLKEKSFE